ncbi:hypothetical protein QYM46_13195 [Brevibacterium sp. K11IcPPYGO002]|uniref:hypothetical protein n=1 Tax=Brevibacterium sp. K11IcPPYGO002 TaxID=3058837 RepID=UPI003D81C37A
MTKVDLSEVKRALDLYTIYPIGFEFLHRSVADQFSTKWEYADADFDDPEEGVHIKFDTSLDEQRSEDQVSFKLSMSGSTASVHFRSDIVSVWGGLESLADDVVLAEFANSVAIPLMVPYLRESIADGVRRLPGPPFELPLSATEDMVFQEVDE